MKTAQFRTMLEAFAALHERSGRTHDAELLRKLAIALKPADRKSVASALADTDK